MSEVSELIAAEIERSGPISFARFMELALYAPGIGYYERMQAVGREGDFYTSPSVGPLFGELLGYALAEWLLEIRSPQLQIVEAAAHQGHLAHDILSWFARERPGLFARVEYTIIEPSEVLRNEQQLRLGSFSQHMRWAQSVRAIAPVTGIIFANELLDALPVRLFQWSKTDRTWLELGVRRNGKSFSWERLTLGRLPRPLAGLPEALLDVLPDSFITELNPCACNWWHEAAKSLQSGYLFTCDYGLDTEEFLTPHRAKGTIRAYYKHHLVDDVLARPGEQDITAHVNFTLIRKAGEFAGLRTKLDMTQSLFLTSIIERIRFHPRSAGQVRQFQTLTHPNHLGRAFRVLVQRAG